MWWLEFGGIERLVLDLCKEQRRQGMDPAVLVGTASGRMAADFAAEGIPITVAGFSNGFDVSLSKVRTAREAMRKADVVHLHFFSVAFALAAAGIQAPVVFTDHGNAALGRVKSWRDRLMRFLQGRFLQTRAAFVTFISEHTRRMAGADFRLPEHSAIIYNGIDLERRSGDPVIPAGSLPADIGTAFVVGTTSRFAAFKRIDRLIEAFARLDHIDECYLLLVGDGPLRPEYEALVAQLGIGPRTVFTGYQPDVRGHQTQMDVCVFPSAGEPFGLVAVETLALGKPTVVMSDGGGITEIIAPLEPDDVVPGVNGLTARLNAYRNAKREGGVLVSAGMAQRRMEHARRFDIRRMADEFEKVYLAALSGSRKTHA